MKVLSLKLDEDVFNEAERIIGTSHKSRNRYINEAVDFYNRFNARKLLAKKLAKESQLVAADSMLVMEEFENLGYGD